MDGNLFLRRTCATALLGCAIWLIFAKNASAYFDPGTGSMILQGIIATAAAGLAAIWSYWHKLVSFFTEKDPQLDKSTSSDDTVNDGD